MKNFGKKFVYFLVTILLLGLSSNNNVHAAQRALNIVGDKNFSSSNLTPQVKAAHDAFKAYISGSKNGSVKAYPNPYASTSLDDLYSVGRTGGSYIANLLFALRVTGDLSYLDEVAYLMGKVEARFDSTSSPGLLWLQDANSSYYGTKYDHKMDNQLTLAALADGTYAFYANRNNGSNYANLATKWLNYLKIWETKIGTYHGLMHPYTNFAKYNYLMYKVTGESKYLTEFNKRQELIKKGIKTGNTPSGQAIAWDHFVVTDSMYPYGCQLSRYVTYTTQAMMAMYFEGAGMFADKAFQEKLARNIKEDTFRNKTPLISIRMCNNNSSYGLGELTSEVDEANQLPHRSQLNYAYFDSSGVLSNIINSNKFPTSFYYHGWNIMSAARGAAVNPPTIGPTTGPTSTPIPTVRPSSTPAPTVKPSVAPTSSTNPNGIVLLPTEDTFVRSDFEGNGHPTFSLLRILGSPEQISYLKFDLSSLSGANVSRARLRLHVASHDGAQSTGAVSIQPVTASWSGATMNYANHPSASASIGSVVGSQTNTWVEVDITSYIKANLGKTVSFALTTNSTDRTEFDSSETSFSPQLVVSVTSVSTPTQVPTQAPTSKPPVSGIVGDANGDGKVDGIDYVIWLLNYKTDTSSGSSSGDFDSSNRVNMDDFALWKSLYN